MKKVFLTLAVVFATSTVLVSCGGKKDSANEEGSANEASKTETPAVENKDVNADQGAATTDTTKKEGDAAGKVADEAAKTGEAAAKGDVKGAVEGAKKTVEAGAKAAQ
jgi:hypothetical protein